MNRELWKPKSFKKTGKYPCPKCFNGILIGESKLSEITVGGKEMLGFGYPHGINNLFCGILKCNNDKCNEIISANGLLLSDIRDVSQDENGEYVELNLEIFEPKYFFPNLRMFKLSNDVPQNIRNLIDKAFSFYFLDNNACANTIRTAIEKILDDLKAPKKKRNKAGKLTEITKLHFRIENFSKKKPKICKLLMALKIIGNEGSHTENTDDDGILDALEILEMLVEITYVKNNARVERIAEKIIQR